MSRLHEAFQSLFGVRRAQADEAAPDTAQNMKKFRTLAETSFSFNSDWKSVAAAFSCISLVSSALSAMPKTVAKETMEGSNVYEPTDHPVNNLFMEPNRLWDSNQTWEIMFQPMIANGNGFMIVERDGQGNPVGLVPCLSGQGIKHYGPNNMRVITWQLREPLETIKFNHPETGVLHVHGVGFDGLQSPSPLKGAAKSVLGAGTKAQKFLSDRFDQKVGNTIIETNREEVMKAGVSMDDLDDLIEATLKDFKEASSVGKSVIGMPPGLTVKDREIFNAADMQLISIMQWTVEEVCRFFNVPPRMIGRYAEGQRVEMKLGTQSEDFYRNAVRPWVNRLEAQMTRKLLRLDERRKGLKIIFLDTFVRRGSLQEQTEVAVRSYAGGGLVTQNEGRAMLGLGPVDGGNEFQTPVGGESNEGRPPE